MRRLVVLVVAVAGVALYRQRRLERSEQQLGLRDGPEPPIVRA